MGKNVFNHAIFLLHKPQCGVSLEPNHAFQKTFEKKRGYVPHTLTFSCQPPEYNWEGRYSMLRALAPRWRMRRRKIMPGGRRVNIHKLFYKIQICCYSYWWHKPYYKQNTINKEVICSNYHWIFQVEITIRIIIGKVLKDVVFWIKQKYNFLVFIKICRIRL